MYQQPKTYVSRRLDYDFPRWCWEKTDLSRPSKSWTPLQARRAMVSKIASWGTVSGQQNRLR